MNDRVSVGTSYSDSLFVVGVIAGPILLGVAAFLFATTDDLIALVGILAGLGALFLLVGLLRLAVVVTGRKWLADTDRGFVFVAGGREHKFEDEDVRELATKVTARFANGIPKANVRAGTLRVDAPAFPHPIAFKYEWPLDREDPLIDLFERLLNRLTKQAEKELARDGELAGDGWALTRDGLEVPAADGTELLRFGHITAAEVVDGKVCVWVSGEARPAFRAPLDSPNAPVLLQLLAKRLADRPPDDADDPESLGRVIFERNTSHTPLTMLVGGTVAVLLFLGGAAVLYYCLTEPPNNRPPFLFPIILHVAAAGLGAVLWFGRQNVLRCHARGVCRLKNHKATEMRYDEVKTFTYSATRHYHNGAYTGTALVMKFEGTDGGTLDYTTTVRNADESLENLREHVSRVVASGMKRRLDAGKVVYWTDRVAFEPDGIAVVGKSGLFGKEDDQFVEWADVADVGLEAGKFALFARGRTKAVYETPVSTPNFFPGFYLILLVRFPKDPDE